MHLTSLNMRNFRNYPHLELELPAGLIIITGDNAQGKSNLLEAIYLLAIGRSSKASKEREMVAWDTLKERGYAQVAATVNNSLGETKLQVDFQCIADPLEPFGISEKGDPTAIPNVRKFVRVNGIPRLTSELIGHLNVVLFDAADIQLIEGPPSIRRRYLDILLSQVDSAYLRALQRYQRVLNQRNHLLRLIRDGQGQQGEMEFWDATLSQQGAYILNQRNKAISSLAAAVGPLYSRLSSTEFSLGLEYISTVMNHSEEEDLAKDFRQALADQRHREITLGMTQVGPHRDDFKLMVGGHEIGVYGSRGQRRIAALALRLAEVEFLAAQRRDSPIVLLDDILSELDNDRREQVLRQVETYGQVIITTAEAIPFRQYRLSSPSLFRVRQGVLERQ